MKSEKVSKASGGRGRDAAARKERPGGAGEKKLNRSSRTRFQKVPCSGASPRMPSDMPRGERGAAD